MIMVPTFFHRNWGMMYNMQLDLGVLNYDGAIQFNFISAWDLDR
jgi:hypothetical protein